MDEGSLLATLSRYSKVGKTFGGLALRVAGEQLLGREIDDRAYANHLKESLGQLRGPLMKVAQFLATIPEAIPPEYAHEFMELQSNAPSMGPSFVRRRMQGELGLHWQDNFSEFDLKASAAASLGQVHKATLKDGTLVACKLQYPQMQSMVETDLNNLRAILGGYHIISKALNTQEVQKELREKLMEELEYILEAKNIETYRNILKNCEFVSVPQYYPEYSTSKLLTMSWMNGNSLFSILDSPQELRERIADQLFYIWYMPLYHHGIIHGDPHPGNYLITPEGHISLLDFGCIRRFPKQFIHGVLKLYKALQSNNLNEATEAYEMWGFTNLTKAHIELMHLWAKLLFDPLLEDTVRPIQKTLNANKGWETAVHIHKELAKLGGITPPREFVFMDRAAVGLGGVFMRLKVERNWHKLFESIIHSIPMND